MRGQQGRKLLYGASMTVLAYSAWQAAVRPALAGWGKGCCRYSSDCGGSLICCDPPPGWASCSGNLPNYCANSCPPGC